MTEGAPPAYAKGLSPAVRQGGRRRAYRVSCVGPPRHASGTCRLSDAFEVSGTERRRRCQHRRPARPRPRRQTASATRRWSALLDTRRNPDLPEMYADILDVFADWRDVRCSLRMYRNHGPEIASADDLAPHLSGLSEGSQAAAARRRRRATVHAPRVRRRPLVRRRPVALLVQRLQEQVMLHFVGRLGLDLAEPGADRRGRPAIDRGPTRGAGRHRRR